MGKTGRPRSGSMQFWPRVRAKRQYARIRSWPESKEAKLLGFCGYKVGMTQVTYPDNRKASTTKGMTLTVPATILECPPIKIASVRLYNPQGYGIGVVSEILNPKLDKELARKIKLPKKEITKKIEDIKPDDYADIRVTVYTQPKLTNIKKKPELFEMALGGNNSDKLAYIKENLNKDIMITDVFKEGEQLDLHGITKGKGNQGPIKRFGLALRSHKSEKTIRGPGSLGGWKGQAHFMYRIAFSGQTGYHLRTEYNKWLLKIGDNFEEINKKGGFNRFGVVKNQYVLIKGSVSGPSKRIIRLVKPMRPNKKIPAEAPAVQLIKQIIKNEN